MNKVLTDKLLGDYPRLYRAPSNVTQWGFEIDNGWFEIVRNLSAEIEAAAETMGIARLSDEWPRVVQVKEKFGELRVYLDADNELRKALHPLIQRAASIALTTCERCGQDVAGYVPERTMLTICQPCHSTREQEWRNPVKPKAKNKILFLDFDGVLHPDHVYLVKGKPVLRVDGFNLFEFSDVLIQKLQPYPEVKIVLSTSWVKAFRNFQKVKSFLPIELQSRIIGACWHTNLDQHEWEQRTRYQQILTYLINKGVADCDWIAIDNDDQGWSEQHRSNLVLTDDDGGLSFIQAQNDLAEKLELLVYGQLGRG